MFDFHNHFTDKNAILLNGALLPQNYRGQDIKVLISNSEFGLDKRYTGIMCKEDQINLCGKCLQIASDLSLPVQLHCVGYTEEMIKLLKKYKLNKQTVIWHHFTGSKETAKILFDLGVIISIGPNTNKNIRELYEADNLMVLETDYTGSDFFEYNSILKETYQKVANELGFDLETLEELVLNAGKAFTNGFGIGN